MSGIDIVKWANLQVNDSQYFLVLQETLCYLSVRLECALVIKHHDSEISIQLLAETLLLTSQTEF